MIDRISLPCSSSQSLMKQQHLPYLYPTCITSMLRFFTPLTIINISKTMWNYYSHRQNVYVNINYSHRQSVYVNINDYDSHQNVYVNIGRILAAAGKLIEGGHYAAGHVRWVAWELRSDSSLIVGRYDFDCLQNRGWPPWQHMEGLCFRS